MRGVGAVARNTKGVHALSSTGKSNKWFRRVWRTRRRRVRETDHLRRSLRTTSRGGEGCVTPRYYGECGGHPRSDPGGAKCATELPRQTVATNWCSRLVIMQQPSRTQKPKKMHSSAALEVTAVVQEDGPPKKRQKKGKMRVIEKTGIDHVLPAPGP